jgi:hypothetical protein
MTEWISNLDDAVPDNDQVVLAYSKKRGYVLARYSCGFEDYGSYDIEYEFWYSQNDGYEYILDDILYWMPLPEPPDVVDETFGKYKGTPLEKFKENE